MPTKENRLKNVQHLAHEIMDEMYRKKESRQVEDLNQIVDHLSRAIGNFADPFGDYSLDYIEEKVKNAHYLLFKNAKKIQLYS